MQTMSLKKEPLCVLLIETGKGRHLAGAGTRGLSIYNADDGYGNLI